MTPKPTIIHDTECYRNYVLFGFLNVDTGNIRQIEIIGENAKLSDEDRAVLTGIFEQYRVISFNGARYDMMILGAALKGSTCSQMKDVSDCIIQTNIPVWQLGIDAPRADHVDLFEVAPGMASLKIYGGRLHCRRMQDLPIHEAASIAPEQRELLRTYNTNDLTTTKDLWDHLQPQLDLREQMSKVYGIDLRSKSDAQIAEAVIVKEVGKSLGEAVQRPEVPGGTRFKYVPPKWITFSTPVLQELLASIGDYEFLVPDGGNVVMPKELEKRDITIGQGVYRMGIGGLHSSEKCVSHYADDSYVIVDRDVTSYYPMIILNNGLAPAHMGAAFTKCYRGLVDQRIAAKRAGNKVGADTIKIVVNGSFGKLGSKWSKLYSPPLLIQTTLTGQLALLMLIERLEDAGAQIISANTDGVAIKCERGLKWHHDAIVAQWEKETGFETEETLYTSLHSRDVNNYVAIKPDGSLKLKGTYAPPGLMKNPTNQICVEAVIAFLKDNAPIEQTIRQCTDIRKFVTIRQVNGGAVDQQGAYLGKAVRWYYAVGVEGPLRYSVNGYTVARSEGARACMELPDVLPADVDVRWYCDEAKSILADLGVDAGSYLVRDLV